MPLFAKSFQELTEESIKDLSLNTNITRLSAGGLARSILESVNRRVASAYDSFDLNLARAFVSSAQGKFLELIGSMLGVQRITPTASRADNDSQIIKFYVSSGTFGDINNGNDIGPIPQGTLLATEPYNAGITYRTLEEYVLPKDQSTFWISAEATLPGELYRVGSGSLIYHNFTSYTDNINESLLSSNVHPIANGLNVESDTNYRFRIINRVLEAEAANMTAIRLACLTTPGVADIVMLPKYRGIGTTGILIKSTIPIITQSLIDEVTAATYNVQAIGDILYIKGPKEIGVSMKTTIYYSQRMSSDELTDIEEMIKQSIIEYVNALDIGESFFIDRMVSELFAIDSRIMNIGTYGKPFEEMFIYIPSKLEDNKIRQTLLGSYTANSDERVVIEPSINSPIILNQGYTITRR